MTLAFGYVRASTQEEVKQCSNERQKSEILKYAKAKGYDVEFFEDRAKLGKNTQRPEFERDIINYRTKAGREQTLSKGIKFGRPSLKTKMDIL